MKKNKLLVIASLLMLLSTSAFAVDIVAIYNYLKTGIVEPLLQIVGLIFSFAYVVATIGLPLIIGKIVWDKAKDKFEQTNHGALLVAGSGIGAGIGTLIGLNVALILISFIIFSGDGTKLIAYLAGNFAKMFS